MKKVEGDAKSSGDQPMPGECFCLIIRTIHVYFAPGGSNVGFGPRTRLATNALFPERELKCKYLFIYRIADFSRGAELPQLNWRSLRPLSSASLSASWKWARS